MGVLSFLLLIILAASIYMLYSVLNPSLHNAVKKQQGLKLIKSLALLALVIGLLGQLIGLFSAFRAVKMGEVESSSSLFLEGFKISMISSVYGLLIFSVSLLTYWLLKRQISSF